MKENKDFLKGDYKKRKQQIGAKSELQAKKKEEELLKPEEEKKKHDQTIEKAKRLAQAYDKLKQLKIDYN